MILILLLFMKGSQMNDTSLVIEEKVREMMQKKTPSERLKMGASMFETSKYLITEGLKTRNPNISHSELRKELFLIFYGDDLSPQAKEKFLNNFSF